MVLVIMNPSLTLKNIYKMHWKDKEFLVRSDKSGLMKISGLISVEGANWLQENLCAYSEKTLRQGKVRISILRSTWQ